MTFTEKLAAARAKTHSWVCVGLDTDRQKLPHSLREHPKAIVEFNRAIIQATSDVACAFKPNLAFYLAEGSSGISSLAETIASIPDDIPVILDAKFGDIESSARGYAHFAFNVLKVDAVTANPYLGADALAPFLEFQEKAIFLLAHTSNPSSRDLQDAFVATGTPEELPEPLYVHAAKLASRLRGAAQVGLVVGATFPDQLQDVRQANPGALFLIPGVGTQGGSLAQAVEFGLNDAGVGPLINASRSILYASQAEDYAKAARAAAVRMRDEINAIRKQGGTRG